MIRIFSSATCPGVRLFICVKFSHRLSQGRVPFVPGPASSSHSCPTPASFAALQTQGRDECAMCWGLSKIYASYKHVLYSPSAGAPQVAQRRSAYAWKLTLTRGGGSRVVYSLSIWLFPFFVYDKLALAHVLEMKWKEGKKTPTTQPQGFWLKMQVNPPRLSEAFL